MSPASRPDTAAVMSTTWSAPAWTRTLHRLAWALAAIELMPIVYLSFVVAQDLRDWEQSLAVDFLVLTAVPTLALVAPGFALVLRGRIPAGCLMLILAPIVWVLLMLSV